MSREPASTAIARAITFVIDRFDEPLSLTDLADAAGMSRFGFCRSFRRELGTTPLRWLWSFRATLAAELIDLMPGWTLTEIWTLSGFTSSAHFSRVFKGLFRVAPSVYRNGRREGEPRSTFPLPKNKADELGRLIDAATARALAATKGGGQGFGLDPLAAREKTP